VEEKSAIVEAKIASAKDRTRSTAHEKRFQRVMNLRAGLHVAPHVPPRRTLRHGEGQAGGHTRVCRSTGCQATCWPYSAAKPEDGLLDTKRIGQWYEQEPALWSFGGKYAQQPPPPPPQQTEPQRPPPPPPSEREETQQHGHEKTREQQTADDEEDIDAAAEGNALAGIADRVEPAPTPNGSTKDSACHIKPGEGE
jgi:hypothetical protein